MRPPSRCRRGRPDRSAPSRGAVAAACVTLAVAACGVRAAPAKAGGGMNSNVKVVGDVGPKSDVSGAVSTSSVDAVPIVLWDRAGQPVVLRYENHVNQLTNHVKQRFVRADGRHGGPFPVSASDTLPLGALTEDLLDLYDPQVLPVADVDGDGADELVLLRQGGSAEILGIDRVVARSPGMGGRVSVAGYFPRSVHRARIGKKDVLFVVYARKLLARATDDELARRGFAARHLLVRIDDKGSSPLAIESDAFRPKEVVAVGALSRPGSAGIDEIVAVSRMNDGEMVLSRHAPDGKLVAPPRKIYVPFPDSRRCAFEFVPQSDRAVAFDPTTARLYFVAPDKPANWIRAVDLAALSEASKGPRQLLGVADGAAAPKAIVALGEAVFAVDEGGAFHVAGPGAGWTPSRKPEPFVRIAKPSPKHYLVGIFRSADRPDELLAVYSRAAEAPELPLEELVAAAERYLPAEKLAQARGDLVPTLEGRDRTRDRLIEEERVRKGGDPPRTVDEWRARFPDSWAKWDAAARSDFRISLQTWLVTPREPEREDFRDFDGWTAWRKGLISPAETSFSLVRHGAVVASFRVPGQYRFADSVIGRPPVEFRARGESVTAALALDVVEGDRAVSRFVVATGP